MSYTKPNVVGTHHNSLIESGGELMQLECHRPLLLGPQSEMNY